MELGSCGLWMDDMNGESEYRDLRGVLTTFPLRRTTLELSQQEPLRGYLRIEGAYPYYDLVQVEIEVCSEEVWVSFTTSGDESFFVPLEGENPDYQRRLAIANELEKRYGAFVQEYVPPAVFTRDGVECIRCDWRLHRKVRIPADASMVERIVELFRDLVAFTREFQREMARQGHRHCPFPFGGGEHAGD